MNITSVKFEAVCRECGQIFNADNFSKIVTVQDEIIHQHVQNTGHVVFGEEKTLSVFKR